MPSDVRSLPALWNLSVAKGVVRRPGPFGSLALASRQGAVGQPQLLEVGVHQRQTSTKANLIDLRRT